MTPHVICLVGTLHTPSRLEGIVRAVGDELEGLGMRVTIFDGASLELPFYRPDQPGQDPRAVSFLQSVADSDGVVLGSPAYHGSVSGLLKNALDYVNELGSDQRPFLDGRPVGCVTVGDGAQGAATTLTCLRTIAHALRGWPTPLGIAIGGRDEAAEKARIERQLPTLAGQVARLALLSARSRARHPTTRSLCRTDRRSCPRPQAPEKAAS